MPLDLSNYGNPVNMGTKDFTRDVQEKIIGNYFNGTPGGVYNEMAIAKNEQAVTQQPMQQQRPSNIGGDNGSVTITREQYEQLMGNRSGMNTPVQPSPQMNAQQPQQQQTAQQQYNQAAPQQAQQNEPNNELNDYQKMMNEILGLEVSPSQPLNNQQQTQTPPQNIQEPQQQGQPSFEELQYQQRLDSYSRSKGLDSKEVVDFASKLSVEDLVDLYDAYKKANTQQQQRPINLSETNGFKGREQTNSFPMRQNIKSIF